MENTILQLLNSLDKSEKKHFLHKMELLDKPGKGLKILHFIEKVSGQVDKIALFAHLYGQRSYQDVVLRQDLFQLKVKLEQFIVELQLKADKAQHQLILAQALQQRKLPRLAEQVLNKLEPQTPMQQLTLALDQQALLATHIQRGEAVQHQAVEHALDSFYLIEKLKLEAMTRMNNRLSGQSSTGRFMDVLLADTAQLSFNPLLQAFVDSVQLYDKHCTDAFFQQTKTRYLELLPTLNRTDKHHLFTCLLNYAIHQINHGQQAFMVEAFSLYQTMADQDFLYQGEYLSQFTFKNIVTLGLRSKAFDWTKQFMDKYIAHLDPAQQANAMHYNLAHWHFSQGQHRKAQSQLLAVVYDDVFYGLDSRSLLLKIYYELDQAEAAYNLIESFRLFLRRKRDLSVQRRLTYLNLLKIVKALLDLQPRDTKSLKKLHQRFQGIQAIADKTWVQACFDKKGLV